MEQFKDFIDNHEWRRATTWEEKAPHEYIVKLKLDNEDRKIFEEIVEFIDINGYAGQFLGRWYKYFNYNGHRYWMDRVKGNPIILNRTQKNREFL